MSDSDGAIDGIGHKVAGAAVGAAALSGVASGDSSGSWLFDPSQVGVEDGIGFVDADVAELRSHDDLLVLEADDLLDNWTGGGSASFVDVASDIDSRIEPEVPVDDIEAVTEESDLSEADVDRVAGVWSTQFGADDRANGLVLEGAIDRSDVIEPLEEATKFEDLGAAAGYDLDRVVDDRLEDDVVLATTDGHVLVGGEGTDGTEVVDLLVDTNEGDAPRLGLESDAVGDILDELSDMPAVAGVEWTGASESENLVPDHVEPVLQNAGYFPEDVDLAEITSDVAAVAVGVDPADRRSTAVVAYNGSPPVEAVRDVKELLEDEYGERFEDIDGELSIRESGDLLVVEASTTAEEITDIQEGVRSRADSGGPFEQKFSWAVLPTLKSAYGGASGYWDAFVDSYL